MRERMRSLTISFGLAVMLGAMAPVWAACATPVAVCPQAIAGAVALIRAGHPATVLTDANADPAVAHAAASLAADEGRVGGTPGVVAQDPRSVKGAAVVIGVAGRSALIDGLIRKGRISIADIAGRWEGYRQIVVDRPWPNVSRALVIVGADRRGAVFGTYDVSEKIGVSPWYWFADAPIARRTNVYVTAGARSDWPRVKYRGFFINDEAPALSTWAQKKFGGLNARMYAHVFELQLRLKGNYLWPAMWSPHAFAADDPRSMTLADEMGVVMGTSHHEPMMRAYEEWHRQVDAGPWDYRANAETLRAFWRAGMARMMGKKNGSPYESVVTVGMRGDGDGPMVEGTATSLLETIVADQRRIIAEETGKPADQTPQVWALYKEVQDYYDRGMQVPDDVTLLFADDNWGQIRRLPTKDLTRRGGYGVYYHLDYVGAPRNYKWIDTNQIEKIWQQMDLAYARGARTVWVVNVGDIKPLEFPLSFFMAQAWNPETMSPTALAAYPADWAGATFGPALAGPLGALLTRYGQLAAWRKPELIDADSFRLGEGTGAMLDGGEFGAMVAAWDRLEADTMAVKAKLPADARDAYFQLIEHRVCAMANLYRLYYDVAWNRRLAAADDARANVFADLAEAAFQRDAALSAQFHAIHGGKWDGMMLQTHIGYTGWQEPTVQVMPAVTRVSGTAAPLRFAVGASTASADAVTIEAAHYTRAFGGKGMSWTVIPHLGRTQAVVALPQGRDPTTPADAIRLEYDMQIRQAGALTVSLSLSPTLNTQGSDGVRLGISLDDGPVVVAQKTMEPLVGSARSLEQKAWVTAVQDNLCVLDVALGSVSAGMHTIKIWRLDDNVVLENLSVGIGQALASPSRREAVAP